MTLSFNLAPGVALGDAVTAIQKTAAAIHMPAAIQQTFQGTAQAFQASLKTAPFLILAALLAVYIILGVLYESYIHPLTILSTLPSAGVGALLMLMLFHFDLSVVGLIGIILLIGIVKKNGIMMVDFAIHAEREQHLEPQAAIRQACLLRFRPIMMTTMAAILGRAAAHARPRHRLGAAPAARLYNGRRPGALSQMLTLFTTPVIYLYLDRLVVRWARKHPHAEGHAARRHPAPQASAMKILLVEDNERVARFVTRGLREAGHTVEHADNGRDGLFIAASEPYDVIVMDRMLPGNIDGLAIIEALRKSGNRTPILILSALADVDERIRGLRSGGDDYLTKPFAFGELLARRRCARAARRGARRRARAAGRRPAHGPAVAARDARRAHDHAAAARVQAARVPDAPRQPGGDAHHAAGSGLGLQLRPADQRGRRAHQQAAPEDRARLGAAAGAHGAQRRLHDVRA